MRKRVLSLSLLSGLVAFALVVGPAAVVRADEGDGAGRTTSTEDQADSSRIQERAEQKRQRAEQQTERKKERLEAAKLRVCEQREKVINAIMTRRIAQAEKHVATFTKITDRVQTFYIEKGKPVANYDDLVATVGTAKDEVQASILALKDTDTLDCSAEDPKATVEAFKAAHQGLRDDLKAYRTAVKNLIVAVKTAQGEQ